MKTYVLTISDKFPKTHIKAGKKTHFQEQIFNGSKKHTIRDNYPLWKKRIEEVQKGNAVLSIRIWEDKPYRSKQIEIKKITAEHQVGIQKLFFSEFKTLAYVEKETCLIDQKKINIERVAKNDGLTLFNFVVWFHTYEKTTPKAIIHFTNFRY